MLESSQPELENPKKEGLKDLFTPMFVFLLSFGLIIFVVIIFIVALNKLTETDNTLMTVIEKEETERKKSDEEIFDLISILEEDLVRVEKESRDRDASALNRISKLEKENKEMWIALEQPILVEVPLPVEAEAPTKRKKRGTRSLGDLENISDEIQEKMGLE